MAMCCCSGGNHADRALLAFCLCLGGRTHRLLLLLSPSALLAARSTTAPQHQAACSRKHATVCAAQRATSWMQSASGATIQ
jgi:hypothetical protein